MYICAAHIYYCLPFKYMCVKMCATNNGAKFESRFVIPFYNSQKFDSRNLHEVNNECAVNFHFYSLMKNAHFFSYVFNDIIIVAPHQYGQ